ncbi:MAG: hypothetical protein RMX65_009870 [Nostoc sp. DedQUE01]|nr:hypothetical protein [Nostoc sp. DedQUE01]
MSLLDECITALGDNTTVLSSQETENIFSIFEAQFPITRWARIDWGKINQKITVNSNDEIISYLQHHFTQEDLEEKLYILWNDASLPAVQAKLEQIIRVRDDVTAVSFDTWIFSLKFKYVIEFYHEGEITIGITVDNN